MKFSALLLTVGCVLGVSSVFAQDKMDKGAEIKHFAVVAPGVVKDKRTGLEWMRCSLGQDWNEQAKACSGDIEKFTFSGAWNIAKKLNLVGGYAKRTNWRVPTVRELQGLRYCSNNFEPVAVDIKDGRGTVQSYCFDGSITPTIAQAAFPNTASLEYWSSTPSAIYSSGGWLVNFRDGGVGYDDGGPGDDFAVRLVR